MIGSRISLSDAQLEEARQIWTDEHSYDARVASLTEHMGLLRANVTIFDDQSSDTIGGEKELDLYFAKRGGLNKDQVEGLTSEETLITFLPVLAADIDMDGDVDFADFVTFSNNFGLADASILNPNADINENGTVDFSDFVILSNSFGQSAVAAATSDFGAGNALLENDGRLKQRYEASVDVVSQMEDVVASPVARMTEGGQPASVDTHFRRTRPSEHEKLFANVDDLLLVGAEHLLEWS